MKCGLHVALCGGCFRRRVAYSGKTFVFLLPFSSYSQSSLGITLVVFVRIVPWDQGKKATCIDVSNALPSSYKAINCS